MPLSRDDKQCMIDSYLSTQTDRKLNFVIKLDGRYNLLGEATVDCLIGLGKLLERIKDMDEMIPESNLGVLCNQLGVLSGTAILHPVTIPNYYMDN